MKADLTGKQRALESQLATTTSSIRLLQAEVKREEAELAKDKLKLEELERNAKAAEAERKRLNKNVRLTDVDVMATKDTDKSRLQVHPVLKQLDESNVEEVETAEFKLEMKNEETVLSEVCPRDAG